MSHDMSINSQQLFLDGIDVAFEFPLVMALPPLLPL
jgi:hypothetical protein